MKYLVPYEEYTEAKHKVAALPSIRLNRDLISNFGGYIEIYVNTPLEVCERRDAKGLYAKARKGDIKEFTGISDPYEAPENPELNIDSSHKSPEQLVQDIIIKLKELGYL